MMLPRKSLGARMLEVLETFTVASNVARALDAAGGTVYIVGGAPRDVLLGNEPNDIDLMVRDMSIEQAQRTLQHLGGSVSLVGSSFAVLRYAEGFKHPVEISLPRREESTGPGHKDFDVVATPDVTVEEDLGRRDFTVNALAVEYPTGLVFDPHDGIADIEARVLRVLSTQSFEDDPLRIMRGLVACARHGLLPEPDTYGWMIEYSHRLEHLPVERMRDELDKMMRSDNPHGGITLAHHTGTLRYLLPEVESAFGYDQNNPHHELELGAHLLNVLKRLAARTGDGDLRLAGLLHDIGKPLSAWVDPLTGMNHYYEKRLPDGTILGADHEAVGAALTFKRMTALKYANDRISRVTGLVEHHMFGGFNTTKGARRFLARVGDLADDLFLLRWADQGGKDLADHLIEDGDAWDLQTNRRLVEQVRAAGDAFDRGGLVINGADLIELGIEPGPGMGQVLKKLVDLVVDDPAQNERESLLEAARCCL